MSTVHTLKVAEQIKERRKKALLGGGEKRIDAQHKKVCKKYVPTYIHVGSPHFLSLYISFANKTCFKYSDY